MSTDWAGISEKIKEATRRKVEEKVDRMMLGLEINPVCPSIKEAGEKLSDIIEQEVDNSILTYGQKSVIPRFTCGVPKKTGRFRYSIELNHNPVSSPSLAPETFGYIDDLTVLFDKGAKDGKMMQRVHGYWNTLGEEIWSTPQIPRAGFIRSAKNTFMRLYGNQYHIIECKYDTDKYA